MIRVHLRIWACMVVLLLLTSCSSASTAVASTPTSRAPTPTATTTISTRGGPAPATAPLAPPPLDCPLQAPPEKKHLDRLGLNTDVQLIGGGPFWLWGTLGIIHMASIGTDKWPIDKIVVEVGPDYDQPVTLRLLNQQTNELAWWTDGETPPGTATQVLVLDPQTDNESVGYVPGLPNIPHGSPGAGWKEWGTFPLFTSAGCYALEVSWAGGFWQSIFAVGE